MKLVKKDPSGFLFESPRSKLRIAMRTMLIVLSLAGTSAFADDWNQNAASPPPPERANQAASSSGATAAPTEAPPAPARANQQASFKPFTTTDIQFLYGSNFREPGINRNVAKGTVTLENSSAWSWGSSYFFIDFLKSNYIDSNAAEFYTEWYPSVSLARTLDKDGSKCLLKDILITMGFNAGAKTTGAAPFVFLPGLTFDLQVPGFQFFSVGVYAHIDQGQINGRDNGNHATTYQITPSWSMPIEIGCVRFRFDGFVDFIGRHRNASSQIVAQPTIKLDVGNFGGSPNRLFVGIEWALWQNKFGIKGLNQNTPQAVVMWVF